MRAPSTAVVTDARRKEVYWAVYDESGARVHGPDVGKPADVQPLLTVPRIVGDGAQLYGFATEDEPRYPSVALLATSTDALPLTPLYLRRPDAQEMAAR
jgi:tRNA A37 threonylcarbamoyladenosine modification protein TsaB